MKQNWKLFALYLGAIAGSLILLACVAAWGYKVRHYFPNTALHSSDVMTVLFTVALVVANISLVMTTRRYTEIAAESIELSKMQEHERQSIRFKHGLETDPLNADPISARSAVVWIANLGVRSFLVKDVEVLRHDRIAVHSVPPFARTLNEFRWNEVVQPGEKKRLVLPDNLWKDVHAWGIDVQVTVSVTDDKDASSKTVQGFHVRCGGHQSRPYFASEGFDSLWFPHCPRCGAQAGMFTPHGAHSFEEVERDWMQPIWSDLATTCPSHASEKFLKNRESSQVVINA